MTFPGPREGRFWSPGQRIWLRRDPTTSDPKRLTKEKQKSCACMSHLDMAKYIKRTDICVGVRVAISTVNFLSQFGLFNGAIGYVVEIEYKDRPVGPNDKQHYHLPNYVLVNFPNLKLPSNVATWDTLHRTVSKKNIHIMIFFLFFNDSNPDRH